MNWPQVLAAEAENLRRRQAAELLVLVCGAKWVQPVWLQPSRDRKPLRYREEVLARRIGPGSEVRPRGHYSQSRLKGEAQGTYPNRCSTSPKRERSGVGPHERRSE